MEVAPDDVRQAIERLHDCSAQLRKFVEVREEFKGAPVWNGSVHVFDIEGHRTATTCYAWSSPVEGCDRRRFYAVLHIPPVDSPEKAVRAAIVQDYRSDKS